MDVLKEAVYKYYTQRPNTFKRLAKNSKLKALIEQQIRIANQKVYYSYDENRLCRILVKLAKGHAGYEFDHISFDDDNIEVTYDFIFNMAEETLNKFDEIPEMSIFPEVGSRSCAMPNVVQNIITGKSSVFMFWNEVQENQYRYQVSYNESGGICVKIVIYEMLYARIDFG